MTKPIQSHYEINVVEPLGDRTKLCQLEDMIDRKKDFVLFKTDYEGWSDKVCLLIHGTPKGNMVIGGKAYSSESVLRFIVDNFLKDRKDIKEVKTISCMGGLQEEATYKGVKISSMHDCIGKVYSASYVHHETNRTIYRLGIPK